MLKKTESGRQLQAFALRPKGSQLDKAKLQDSALQVVHRRHTNERVGKEGRLRPIPIEAVVETTVVAARERDHELPRVLRDLSTEEAVLLECRWRDEVGFVT
jgi:hypothetical protein